LHYSMARSRNRVGGGFFKRPRRILKLEDAAPARSRWNDARK
jgi:hypothetical protein